MNGHRSVLDSMHPSIGQVIANHGIRFTGQITKRLRPQSINDSFRTCL